MINYHAYLEGHILGLRWSKGELKLRGTRRMGCPKKTAKAMNTFSEAYGVGIRILHLESKKVFGSTKRKLGVPLGDAKESHS